MKKLIIGIVFLAILIIPLASANGNANKATIDNNLSESYTFTTNESTSKVLVEIYGTNITMAEFMEQVYPGSLNELPRDSVARLQKTPMIWPDPQKIKPGITNVIKSIKYVRSGKRNN